MPAAWKPVIVAQSFVMGTGNPFEAVLVKDGVDYLVVEGRGDTRYAIPHFRGSAHHPEVNVPICSWRSVGHTHNSFVMETLIEELATRARIDPIAYRVKLLSPDANAPVLIDGVDVGGTDVQPAGKAAGHRPVVCRR